MTHDHNDPERNRGMEALRGPDPRDAEIARLREALWVATEHNALHFGESHSTVIQGRGALAQEQGGRDVTG